MKTIWTIARRELRAMFDHPTGYILLVVFITLNNFLFFRQAFLLGVASLRPMLEFLPWLMLFFVPAVTMGALAEDVRAGTIEVVLAQPVNELELMAGKYLGRLLFILVALALTLGIPLGFSLAADLQVGVIVAQYFGAALLAVAFTAIGIWASSLSRNQITAFIIGVAVMFVFVLVGFGSLLVGLPPVVAGMVANLAILSHFANIARGVIDLRDVVYFLSLAAIFLVLGLGSLLGRKLSPRGRTLARLRLGTVMMVLSLVIVNLFGRHIGGRLDLTPGRAYTLSPATRTILSQLPDLVTIRLFVTKELPPEVTLLKRDVDDLLSDFRSAGGGKVRLVVLDPAEDEAAADEARSLGIPPVQFNVARKAEFQIKEGYLGLAVQYAGDSKVVPVIQRTDDLEYQLISDVRMLTREHQPVVGLYTAPPGFGQRQAPGFTGLEGQLRKSYEVRRIELETDSLSADQLSALILEGTPPLFADSIANKIEAYLRDGGSALVLARGMQMPAQQSQPIATATPVVWNRILQPYGVSIAGDMVWDLSSNEAVSMRASFGNVLVNYPFWLKAISTKASTINAELGTLFMPWSSTIDWDEAPAGIVTPLFTTSKNGGTDVETALISPQRREFSRDSLETRVVAVQVVPAAGTPGDSALAAVPSGRLVIAGNDDFLSDQWASGATSQNLTFALNAVDWLAQDEALIAIRAKDRTPPSLVFGSDGTRSLVHYGNLGGVPLLVILLGGLRLYRRRRLTRRRYSPVPEAEAA